MTSVVIMIIETELWIKDQKTGKYGFFYQITNQITMQPFS